MPFSMEKLPDSAKNLTDSQKSKFISIANAMMKQPAMDESMAIATAMKKCKEFSELSADEFVEAIEEFIAARKDITPADKVRAQEKYGKNIPYADEKNKKYPIDNPEHVRAAASYFGMPKNREQYSPEDQKAIASKIAAAEKKFGIGAINHSEDFFEGQWVEVFKSGKQTDSAGNTREWTNNDLNTIASKYNSNKTEHEAPLVVGHPKTNAPAFGWVEELKAEGDKLFAKFKQVMPEFADAVKEGRYKKRSISLRGDFGLRHIGFLGAAAPAVKGLADILFSEEEDSVTIEFSNSTEDNDINNDTQKGDPKMDEKMKALETKIESFNETIDKLSKANDVLAAKNEELTSQLENAGKKEFEEDADARIKAMETQLAVAQQKNRVAEYKEFVNALHGEGKLVTECKDMVIDLMEAMHDKGTANFSEGEASILDTFKSYLAKQPKLVEFNEVNTEKAKKQTGKTANEQLVELAEAKVKESNISFSEAFSLVQVENSELAEKAYQEI